MAKKDKNRPQGNQSAKQDIPSIPQGQNKAGGRPERPISSAHGPIDTDLARDNLENDLPAAELDDL